MSQPSRRRQQPSDDDDDGGGFSWTQIAGATALGALATYGLVRLAQNLSLNDEQKESLEKAQSCLRRQAAASSVYRSPTYVCDGNQAYSELHEEYPRWTYRAPTTEFQRNRVCVAEPQAMQFKTGKAVLHGINALIKLNEEDTKRRVGIVESVRVWLVGKLRQDPLFNLLFREFHYTGSYYDGLRLEVADEFDLNLVLTIEELQPLLTFVAKDNVAPGFLQVNLTSNEADRKKFSNKPGWLAQRDNFYRCLTSECPVGVYWIDPDKVRRWFQSLVDKTNIRSCTGDNIARIEMSQSGPARTLIIHAHRLPTPISVDLVPVFEFMPDALGSSSEIYNFLWTNGWLSERFSIVPKPLKDVPVENAEKFWRLDFHKIEAKILLTGYSKTIIRLLKKFRDGNSSTQPGRINVMTGLSSYALKTVVMIMVHDRTSSVEWTDSNSTVLFLEALEALQGYLEKGKIPYFFHRGTNQPAVEHDKHEEVRNGQVAEAGHPQVEGVCVHLRLRDRLEEALRPSLGCNFATKPGLSCCV